MDPTSSQAPADQAGALALAVNRAARLIDLLARRVVELEGQAAELAARVAALEGRADETALDNAVVRLDIAELDRGVALLMAAL
jgi:hypothetical protein